MPKFYDMPETLRKFAARHPEIVDMTNETDTGDGYWIYLATDWFSYDGETQCIHENTVKECLKAYKTVRYIQGRTAEFEKALLDRRDEISRKNAVESNKSQNLTVNHLQDERYSYIPGDSDDMSLVRDTVSDRAEDCPSFFVGTADGEVTSVWGCTTYVPYLTSPVIRIY